VRIGAPYSDEKHSAVCEDLQDFRLDGDCFRFVLVWCDAPEFVGIEVRVGLPYDGDLPLCERLIGHGIWMAMFEA
jgi:hypothetical protein